MNKKSKPVIRKCVGCSQKFPKENMLRIVRTFDAEGKKFFQIDSSGKMDGRGAYLCKNVDCLKKAAKGKRFERSFKSSLGKNFYEMIDVNE